MATRSRRVSSGRGHAGIAGRGRNIGWWTPGRFRSVVLALIARSASATSGRFESDTVLGGSTPDFIGSRRNVGVPADTSVDIQVNTNKVSSATGENYDSFEIRDEGLLVIHDGGLADIH